MANLSTRLIEHTWGKICNILSVKVGEPVVVIESDDWGLERSNMNRELLNNLGVPKFYSNDNLETRENLKDLFHVLSSYKDKLGNPWKFTANFIVENPDFEKTIQNDYKKVYWKPIYENIELLNYWKLGYTSKVFYPQYHGRSHFNPTVFENDLIYDKHHSRRIFNYFIHGGLNNIKGFGWRLHGEYFEWNNPKGITLKRDPFWLRKGINIFKKTFGYLPESTIPPHYMLDYWTLNELKKLGIKYLQSGADLYYVKKDYRLVRRKFPQGYIKGGIVHFKRNVRFEPCRSKQEWNHQSAFEQVKHLFKRSVPVIIDSHRINYTTPFIAESLDELRKLLDLIKPFNPVVMSTDEFGEAILNGGLYTNRFSGETSEIKLKFIL